MLLPFIKDGYARGDRAVHVAAHVVDRARRADHVRRLEAAGLDPGAFLRELRAQRA